MRVAVVGKGGSGKTTVSAALIQEIIRRLNRVHLLAIDADINMHLGPLFGVDWSRSPEKHLSNPVSIEQIKRYLIGNNARIHSLSAFRKTTPPGNGSNLLFLETLNQTPLSAFDFGENTFHLMAVGTYSEDGLGTSCYHNNLSILENILSHASEGGNWIVVDMVAGTDAFASSLHAQFDIILLVVEPTRQSTDVWNQFVSLASAAGISNRLFAVGNKVNSTDDEKFLSEKIPENMLLGFLSDSKYLRDLSRRGGNLELSKLEEENRKAIQNMVKKMSTFPSTVRVRYAHLCALHRKYVAQNFITAQFGDLTTQIDPNFNLDKLVGKIK
ncbi:MAG: ATP-binding protein [Candidatus Diapherotrites archaeon]|uniref:ATP-binding protein n=1 Tax=Candidatus Iainarchaeum sp. TaxID=3101447 RepID=A0A8T4C7P8_9ARCH|nr:ATP-binding protein [Candidatus Diapherotrites archaeon]